MKPLLILITFFAAQSTWAQNTFRAKISDAVSKEPLVGATAIVKSTLLGATTGIEGDVVINNVPNGTQLVEFRYNGYESQAISYSFPMGNAESVEILLQPDKTNLDEVVVSATRSSRSIDDIPMRIETITAGELEEKAVMQPSNIRMLLTESTGIQTQQTSATSASTSIRVKKSVLVTAYTDLQNGHREKDAKRKCKQNS